MSKFRVKVTIKAEYTYEVEMDEDSEDHAEDRAIKLWREKMPEDFQVEKGYITDSEAETEQLTTICPDCGVEHTIPTVDKPDANCWAEDYEYCKPCGAKIDLLEQKANGQ